MQKNWHELIVEISNMPSGIREQLIEKLTEDLFIKYQIHPEIVNTLGDLNNKQRYAIYLAAQDIAAHNKNISKAITKFRKKAKGKELTIKDQKFFHSLEFISDTFSVLQSIPIELVNAIFDTEYYDLAEKNVPVPRFDNQKWSQIVNKNFDQVSGQLKKERGKKAKLARLISENTGISPRQAERYLDGDSELTAEVVLMFEEVLNIHRDQLLGDFINSTSDPNMGNLSDIKEFRILYSLMKKNEMLSEDIKKILKDISKIYSDLEIRSKSLSKIDSVKNYELMRKMLTDFMDELKSFTT